MRIIYLIALLAIKIASCYRLLGLFPLPVRSHFSVFEKLMKGLAEKGHQVDVLSHYPQEEPIPRYTDISISGELPPLENNISYTAITYMPMQTAWYVYGTFGADLCEQTLKLSQVRELKNNKNKYDAIIVEIFGTDCLLGFAYLFGTPIIGISSTMQLPWINDRIGNPDNPSYIPNYFTPRKGRMILLHKLETAAVNLLSKIGYHIFSTIPSEMRARDFFGNDMPSLDYLAMNTSLVLVNSHFLINEPRPNVPGFVEIGGIHINKLKPLPKNLSQMIKSAEHGIIYFSMGTVIRMDTFPKESLKKIIDSLGKLPHTVLMKISKNMFLEPFPQNFITAEWWPQLDILCDPKTKLFISHGGQLSMQEALFCGVPVLGIPLVADQALNIFSFQNQKAGILLSPNQIPNSDVYMLLKNLLLNDNYKNNAKRVSHIYNDRLVSPLDAAVYWVEYVVRHNGARHLRTRGADLIWFEFYLVDVALVATVGIFVAAFLFFYLLNLVQNYFDNPPPKNKSI